MVQPLSNLFGPCVVSPLVCSRTQQHPERPGKFATAGLKTAATGKRPGGHGRGQHWQWRTEEGTPAGVAPQQDPVKDSAVAVTEAAYPRGRKGARGCWCWGRWGPRSFLGLQWKVLDLDLGGPYT